MIFHVSTHPLANALNLGIVSQNVSKFYHKSCLAQVTATRHELKINLEAANVLSEIRLKGSGDADGDFSVFVDCLLLKQLVSTFEAAVTSFEFIEGGLVLHSGKSKFTLNQMADSSEFELAAPDASVDGEVIPIDQSDWKFIKDHQMYAIAMSFIHPVYTRAWVSESGDVLIGDSDNSIFTHSTKSKLGNTCLLSDTIINLFNSLPEGATLRKIGPKPGSDRLNYVINVNTDGFEYAAEFTPMYESDEGIGSYNAEMILSIMQHSDSAVKMNTVAVNKVLNQAALLSSGTEDSIEFSVTKDHIVLSGANVECTLAIDNAPEEYRIEFKSALLKSAMAKFDEDTISVAPMWQDSLEGDDGKKIAGGIIAWSKNMTIALGGLE